MTLLGTQVLVDLVIDRGLVLPVILDIVDEAVQAVEELLVLVARGRLHVVVDDFLGDAGALLGVVGIEALGLDRQGLEHEGPHGGPSEVGDGVPLPIILVAEFGVVQPAVDGRAVHADKLGGLADRFGGDQMGDCDLLSFGEFFFGICCVLLHFVAFPSLL